MFLHKAIEFAAIKHNNQKRKGGDTPYIVHPLEVMQILTDNGCEEKVIIAGILHDTLEDTDTTIQELTDNFGEEIANLVKGESEDKSKSWQERKQTTIDNLVNDSFETKLICCADKLSNLKSMYCDYQKIGEKLWARFNAPKEKSKWYYNAIINAIAELEDYNMFKELKFYYGKLFVK